MLLTPESSVEAQKQLGADIIIPLDELPPYHTSPDVLAASLARSHRWMARSLATHLADVRQQAMYAVVHGGMSLELRQQVGMRNLPTGGGSMVQPKQPGSALPAMQLLQESSPACSRLGLLGAHPCLLTALPPCPSPASER